MQKKLKTLNFLFLHISCFIIRYPLSLSSRMLMACLLPFCGIPSLLLTRSLKYYNAVKSYVSTPVNRTSVAVPDSNPTEICIQYRPFHGAVILDVVKLKALPSFTVTLSKMIILVPDFKDVDRAAQNDTPSVKSSV